MSGYPDVQSVTRFRIVLRELQEAMVSLSDAERDLRYQESRASKLRQTIDTKKQEIQGLMKQMDTHPPGNMGYEKRLFELFIGLAGQFEDELKKAKAVAELRERKP